MNTNGPVVVRARRRWLSALVLVSACDWSLYDDLEGAASVYVYEAPEGYPRRGFGGYITAYDGMAPQPDGTAVARSRVIATGGTDSPHIGFAAWDRDNFSDIGSVYEGCDDPGDCDDGHGAAVVGVPVWRRGTPDEAQMCILVTSPTIGSYRVECEAQEAMGAARFQGMTFARLGAAAAPLFGADGIAILGGPDAMGGNGLLARVLDGGTLVPVPLPPAVRLMASGTPGAFGTVLATAPLTNGHTLIAASATTIQTVVLLSVIDTGAGVTRVAPHACITSTDGGFGGALTLGDVTGDGSPELFIGSNPDVPNRREVVRVYNMAALPPPLGEDEMGACPTLEPMTELSCPPGLREVECANSGFGAGIAVGDVNADGVGDLLIGAPYATVDGKEKAGAAFLFPGGAGGPETGRADALTHSLPARDAQVGRTVAMVRTQLGAGLVPRSEPVAGSPGSDEVLVFLCSALEGEPRTVGARCQPNQRGR